MITCTLKDEAVLLYADGRPEDFPAGTIFRLLKRGDKIMTLERMGVMFVVGRTTFDEVFDWKIEKGGE